MAAVVSDGNLPAWKRKLRHTANLYRSCAEKGDLGSYFTTHSTALRTTYANVSLVSGSVHYKAEPPPDEILKSDGNEFTKEHQDVSDNVQDVANSLKESNATKEDCITRLQKAREEAKRKSSEIIDDKFGKVESYLSTLTPEQQDWYTDVWIEFVNGFLSFWSQVLDYLWDIVKAVLDWLAGVWEKIKEFFHDVADTFVRAWNFVKSFFG